jgi:hypothetical protein
MGGDEPLKETLKKDEAEVAEEKILDQTMRTGVIECAAAGFSLPDCD